MKRVFTAAIILFTAAIVGGLDANAVRRPAGAPVVKVVGDRHQLALRGDGSVIGWGPWFYGQLGPVSAIGVSTPWTDRPVRLEFPGRVVDVAAGDGTSYALLDDGTVWAMGEGRQGELGTGPNPVLPILSNSTRAMEYRGAERAVKVAIQNVAAIAAGGRTAFAILRDGTVRQWPRSRDGKRAPEFQPVAVPRLSGVTQLAVGWSHTLALTADGHVWAWGNNRYGALAQEPKEDRYVNDPVEVAGLADIKAIAAAGDVSFAIRSNGTVLVWGTNGHGQFGNGLRASHPSVDTQSMPQVVLGISNVVSISAATTGRHVFVLFKDGTLRGWGNSDFGQLGAGITGTFLLKPVTPKIANVTSVFAVGNSTFALTNDGSLWGWGTGDRGRWPFARNTAVPTRLTLP
jgi:alpha-tubulin suppressor-like RCC1 family protein